MSDDRNLTDADVEAIANALQRRLVTAFYMDVGRGIWGIVKRVIILGLVALAAYGVHKGITPE